MFEPKATASHLDSTQSRHAGIADEGLLLDDQQNSDQQLASEYQSSPIACFNSL